MAKAMQITLLIVINLTGECNSSLAIYCESLIKRSKKHNRMEHLIHAFTPLVFLGFSHARNIISFYVSHSQHDYICSLGLFMNLRCMLIECVLKHQIKFALCFIRIK